MILVTVGTQLPFDRFIRIVDEAAPSLGRTVFAQVGRGSYQPRNMEYAALIDPLKFDELIARTELIVSHAGIGTVVIGGIFEQNEREDETKVPLLGDLPAIGNLFKTRTRTANKSELLVFISPKMISNGAALR